MAHKIFEQTAAQFEDALELTLKKKETQEKDKKEKDKKDRFSTAVVLPWMAIGISLIAPVFSNILPTIQPRYILEIQRPSPDQKLNATIVQVQWSLTKSQWAHDTIITNNEHEVWFVRRSDQKKITSKENPPLFKELDRGIWDIAIGYPNMTQPVDVKPAYVTVTLQ